MKNLVLTLGVLALTSSMAVAQEPKAAAPKASASAAAPAHSALDKALIANEHKINEAVAKGDKAGFLALLAPDAWSADANGFMKAADFANMMGDLKVTDWKISDEKVSWADPNTAIVTYTWTGSGSFQGQPIHSPTYASTVWTKKAGKWVAVYHQESEAAPKK
jgi:hypothetical protein